MSGAVVLVTMRPEMAASVMADYRRQSTPLPLVVVVNGRAAGHEQLYQVPKSLVFRSRQCKAEALAIGEHKAKNDFGAEWVSFWDDDDYHGPEYLTEVCKAMEAGADWSGQTSRYVRTSDNRLWRVFGGASVLGCCLNTRVGLADWEECAGVAGPEDIWRMKHGISPTIIPPGHFAQCRRDIADHVWGVSERLMAHIAGGAIDLGPWDPRVVDQEICEPIGLPVLLSDSDKWMDPREISLRSKRPDLPPSEVS